jgi:hypothetical protein
LASRNFRERRFGKIMDEATQSVLAGIQSKIESLLEEVSKLKKTANMVADLAGQGPLYSDVEEESKAVGPTRADAYYGKPLATAVREYLEFRRQAVPVEDIQKGLEQGGFDFDAMDWPKGGRLRYLAISISKNTTVFHKLPNGMWGLNSWYPDATEKKKAKAKSRSRTVVEDENEKGSDGDTTEPKLLTD